MRYDRLTLQDLGPFSRVDIDFAAISGKLIAVCGDNGSGKSTLLELMAGALYRDCPTRGSLTSLATSRNAFVEVQATNGKSYTIRQSADGTSGKSEALIMDDQGRPLLDSARVRDADAWVARHLPAPEVMYASSFLAQQSTGFVELSAGERKRVLLRLLRIEHYEALAERARLHARSCKTECATLRARIDELSGENLETLRAEHARALGDKATEDAIAPELDSTLARLQAELALLEAVGKQADQRASMQDRLDALKLELHLMQERIGNNQKLLGRADAIRKDAAEHRALQAQHDDALRLRDAAAQAAAVLAADSKAAYARRKLALGRVRSAELDIEGSRHAIAAAADGVKARAKLPAAKQAMERAQARVQELGALIDEARTLLVDHKDARIGKLRTGLTVIVKGTGSGAAKTATATLSADDALVRAHKSAPGEIKKLEASLKSAHKTYDEAAETVAELRELAQADKGAKAAQLALDNAKARLAIAEKEAEQEGNAAVVASLEWKIRTREDKRLQTDLGRLAAALLELRTAPDLEQKLDHAQTRLAELVPAAERMVTERDRLAAEIAALPAPATMRIASLQQELKTAQLKRENHRAAMQALTTRIAQLGSRITVAEKALEKTAGLAVALGSKEHDLADYTRLGQDLGKDGLQALEIDASIPELNTLANDLLHSCHGGRFTVELRTDRVAADGKRMLEDLDVRVIDTVGGRDAPVETYSGGEKVIIGEAVSLALTMVACHRAGMTSPTLVRDESGAALDPDNGRAYLAMLRRAAELVGADKVLFVTHDPELQALADARIDVRGGTAVVA